MKTIVKFLGASFLSINSAYLIADNVPASMVIGPVAPSIAADGTTAIVATLKNADGTLYNGNPVTVSFVSPCAIRGLAVLDGSVNSNRGIAGGIYQPRGCTGTDTVTASVTGTSVKADTTVVVSRTTALSAKAALGKAMFFDRELSVSRQQACATCHSPSSNYLSGRPQAVPPGGVDGSVSGFRSAPSAAYASLIPAFKWNNTSGAQDTGVKGGKGTPQYGQMWDGRAATVAEQARQPFTAPHEMANANSAAVLKKLLTRPYIRNFNTIYGVTTSTSNPDGVLANMADAIGTYESEDKSFKLFNSRYDAIQMGLASLTPQEARGQVLFFSNDKGNCAGCHDSNAQGQAATTQPQLFSNFSYHALGVPRNWSLPYNNDGLVETALAKINLTSLMNGTPLGAPSHKYYDMGMCGPFRTDTLLDPTLCGAFRVPSLRNVALKSFYYHNGKFNSLAQVISFYVNRDLTPWQFYTKADGRTPDILYNDLPVGYQGNVTVRPPFTPARGGPRLSATEVQDLIAFLCTLTDGYDPQYPESYRLPQQCRQAIRP